MVAGSTFAAPSCRTVSPWQFGMLGTSRWSTPVYPQFPCRVPRGRGSSSTPCGQPMPCPHESTNNCESRHEYTRIMPIYLTHGSHKWKRFWWEIMRPGTNCDRHPISWESQYLCAMYEYTCYFSTRLKQCQNSRFFRHSDCRSPESRHHHVRCLGNFIPLPVRGITEETCLFRDPRLSQQAVHIIWD